MRKNYYLFLHSLLPGIFFLSIGMRAQNAGINSTGATPNSSSILDLNTGNTFTNPNGKGLIIPNVALTATNASNPVTSPATSLLVYNTATASSGSTAVSPGYYYWDGTKWVTFTGPGSNDWSLTGNAGTVIGTNFLGTTDNVDLQFRANNLRSGLIGIASYNTLFGYAAGLNSTGIINSFFGYGAGQTNSTATGNTGVGYYSLLLNSTGTDNTAVGVQTLYSTTGTGNVAIGTNAGYSITSGTYNTALGYYSMNNGATALTGSYNTGSGYKTLMQTTSGGFNTASGFSALINNSTGSSNSAYGTDALYYMGTPSFNTGVGTYALEGSGTVASNTGQANSALGFCAGSGYTGALGSGTNNNLPLTTGSYNTFLGFSTDMSAGTYSNTTTVGSFAQAGQSDALILGSISGTNGASNSAKVGIGTTTPSAALHIKVPSGAAIDGIYCDVTAGNGAGNAFDGLSTGSVGYSTIYGKNTPTTAGSATGSGTAFDIAATNHAVAGQIFGNNGYSFGVYGKIVNAPAPSGGVLGYYGSSYWGSLGYHNTAGTTSYGGYFATSSSTAGATTGLLANTSKGSLLSADGVGIGSYGSLFGGWIRGDVYGVALKGERVSLYVDGKTVVNQPIVQLTKTSDGTTMVNYMPVSATADLQLHGNITLEKGAAVVTIDPAVLKQFASVQDLTIIVTPGGQTNGVYAELQNGSLIIKENNGGTSGVRVSWIIIGKRNVDADYVPQELMEKDFDSNLRGLMHNENDPAAPSNGLKWDGSKLNKVTTPN